MEKKAPEKKVRLREGDVFYVYDKRINKCIREGCGGTVKYGLTLQVNMENGDTLNTYECNKCHMKYTAYPNYVRLAETKQLAIYNQDEVDARDKKRAADAAKQASREKRKVRARRYASQPQTRMGTVDRKKDSRNRNQRKQHKKYDESHGYHKDSDKDL